MLELKTLLSLSIFTALTTALTPRLHHTFKLRPDPSHSLMGSAGVLGINGQTLQWGLNVTKEYVAFYDEKTKTVNSTDGGILYLRPTHGTPMYYVFSGNPLSDPTPPLTISTWQLRRTSDGKTWLGPPSFLACPNSPKGPSALYLYFGPAVTSRCSTAFGLMVEWEQGPVIPDPTETVTSTVTETATETATETCTTEEPEEPTETCTTEEPEPTESCTEEPTEEPTETVTETETCTTDEPEPTGTVIPPPPPGTNTTVTKPPVPTETEEPPVSGAAGLKSGGGLLALVVAGLAVFVL